MLRLPILCRWLPLLFLVTAVSALPAAACVVDEVIPIAGGRVADYELLIRGTCQGTPPIPRVGYVARRGATHRVVLDGLGGAAGELQWSLHVELGALPGGAQRSEVYQRGEGDEAFVAAVDWEVPSLGCGESKRPGATLLYPYLEVDLDDPTGRTTLVSINNASAEPVLARATLWSDWGFPVLAFDLYLEGDAVVPINLRDVLDGGVLPQTGTGLEPAAWPGCSAPLALPTLDDAALASIRARLTGEPDPETGLCASSDRGDNSLAIGFLTVDTIERCPGEDLYPNDADYFGASGDRVANDLNTLWGDLVLASSSANSASGVEAISILADPAWATGTADDFERLPGDSFYPVRASHRPPLDHLHRSRFFNGGNFAGDTELLVWLGQFNPGSGVACDQSGLLAEIFPFALFSATGEGGGLPGRVDLPISAFVFSLPIDDPRLGGLPAAGVLQLISWLMRPVPILPPSEPLQSVVLTRLEAEGRFSVGYAAISEGRPPSCTAE